MPRAPPPLLRVWLLVAAGGSLFPASGDASVDAGTPPMTFQLDSLSSHFIRVGIPQGADFLQVSVEAARPVAVLLASGYYPSEAHYDMSNFHDWARGSLKSELVLQVGDLRSDACQHAGPQLQSCLQRAMDSGGLACGVPAAADGAVGARGHAQGGIDGLMQLYTVDDKIEGGTEQVRSIPDGVATDGTCMKVTGKVCPDAFCGREQGATHCEDGLCVCQPGHCVVNGVCRASCGGGGRPCADTRSFLSSAASSRQLEEQGDAHAGDSDSDKLCCKLMEEARAVHPEHFTRCAARLLGHGVDAFAAKGVRVPKFQAQWASKEAAPAPKNATDVHEVVVSLRPSSQTVEGTSAATEDEEVSVQVRMAAYSASSASSLAGATQPALQQWDRFYTIPQLLDPNWTRPHLSLPAWRQMELPFHALPVGDADSLAPATPQAALHFQLRANELILLRMDERALQGGGAGSVPHMHVHGLSSAAQVLYGRHWPEPRSPMDFGHALLVGREGAGSTWQAAQLDTRHFAVVSPVDASVSAFFTLRSQSHVLPQGSSDVQPEGSASAEEDAGAILPTSSSPWSGVVACAAGLLLLIPLVWVVVRRLTARRRTGVGGSQPYLAVSHSDQEPSFLDGMLSTSMEAAGLRPAEGQGETAGWSSGDECGGVLVSARPLLTGLKAVGDSLLEKLTSSTRPGSSSRNGASLRSGFGGEDGGYGAVSMNAHTDEEARGLLHGGDPEDEEDGLCGGFGRPPSRKASRSPERPRKSVGSNGGCSGASSPSARGGSSQDRPLLDGGNAEDIAAVEALIRLRPAARDSIGTGDDLDDETPLIGSEREGLLRR